MTSDELKVPSQRADQVDDDGERADDLRRHDVHVGGFRTDDDHAHDAPRDDDSLRDDFRANDTPTADLSREDGVRDEQSRAAVDEETDEDDEGNGAAPAHAAPQPVVLFDQDPAEVQARWRELQTSFVDDPGDAVQRAEGLVEEVVEALTSSLTARTGELRDRWKGAGDTEQLRLALRDYRVVLERLLTLSGHETDH